MGVRESSYAASLGTEAHVTIRGAHVRYFQAGEGPSVVLFHGLGDAAIAWHDNVGPLAQRFATVVPDLPGHGHSHPAPWRRFTVERCAEWVLAFLDALGLEEACLVGNSIGGYLAASAALKHPTRIRRLVLENSAGLGKEIATFLRLMSLPLLGEFLARPTMGNLRSVMRICLYDPSVVSEEFLQALHREMSRPGNKAAMLRMLRSGVTLLGMKGSNILLDRLREMEVPTLVIWGRQDAVLPVAHAHRAVARLPNATLHVFEQCGHLPHMEHRDEFNRLLLEFLT